MKFDKIFNKVLIIDGSYMIHRSLHIPEVFELKCSSGERTGGIFGFLRTLSSELRICGDYFPVVCFDEGLAPRRLAADPNYKKAMELLGTDTGNTIFIGDQLFTDVYGAKRSGIRNILVKPIHPKEEIQIVLKRYLEKIVLHFYKKEEGIS